MCNGIMVSPCLIALSNTLVPSVNVFFGASWSFGCGTVWGTLWLQGLWPPSWEGVNINIVMAKELVPVVIAFTYGFSLIDQGSMPAFM